MNLLLGRNSCIPVLDPRVGLLEEDRQESIPHFQNQHEEGRVRATSSNYRITDTGQEPAHHRTQVQMIEIGQQRLKGKLWVFSWISDHLENFLNWDF